MAFVELDEDAKKSFSAFEKQRNLSTRIMIRKLFGDASITITGSLQNQLKNYTPVAYGQLSTICARQANAYQALLNKCGAIRVADILALKLLKQAGF